MLATPTKLSKLLPVLLVNALTLSSCLMIPFCGATAPRLWHWLPREKSPQYTAIEILWMKED